MTDRVHCLALALWVGTLAVGATVAQEPSPAPTYPVGEPPATPPPATIVPAEPEPIGQWLEEVRAQRRAWEARRQAAKEAIDARRRWLDPWGAAQHEAREQESERRREAFREQIQRDREAFRSQAPWGAFYGPWNEEPMGPDAGFPAPRSADAPDALVQPGAPAAPDPSLPGWNNPWYYRGY